jgi:hypothetical protein
MNKQYIISGTDISRFKAIKESSLYKDYINTIIGSPILINIANEHIKNIDITDEIDTIFGKNPTQAKKLNTLFKDTLKNMAINIVADTLIIKDIADVGFENSIDEIETNFKIKYLMGLADEHFYIDAKKLIDETSDTSSSAYIGYVEYQKRVNANELKVFKIEETKKVDKPIKIKKESKAPIKKVVDISSNDIEF